MPLPILYAAEITGAETTGYETDVTFRGFPWGTSMNEFIGRMGNPISREEINGLSSLLWENVEVNGYMTYMVVYFSSAGLQGGTYYFLTYSIDELMQCYSELREELRGRFGPTNLFHGILREMRHYECFWNLEGGSVHLKTNTRQDIPVTLWFASPELTRLITGG